MSRFGVGISCAIAALLSMAIDCTPVKAADYKITFAKVQEVIQGRKLNDRMARNQWGQIQGDRLPDSVALVALYSRLSLISFDPLRATIGIQNPKTRAVRMLDLHEKEASTFCHEIPKSCGAASIVKKEIGRLRAKLR